MTATIRQIVDDALILVGEVAGVGVQQFSDDRMMKDAIRGFNMMFKKRFWEQYSGWDRVILDGSTGVITTNRFSRIVDFEDFGVVCRAGERCPLPILNKTLNPFTLTGTTALCWTSLKTTDDSYKDRKLKFYPIASTGSIDVYAREYPIDPTLFQWDWEDLMHMDKDLLVNATAFATLIGDALNPEAANVVRGLMDMRYSDIVASIANQPISVSDGDARIPMTWFIPS